MTGVTETHKSRRIVWAQVCRIMNFIVTEKKYVRRRFKLWGRLCYENVAGNCKHVGFQDSD